MKLADNMVSGRVILRSLSVYWKTLFLILYPIALLPLFLMNNVPAWRCLYTVLLMAGYWVLEVLPLAVTSLIPMVLFPLMGVLDSDKVSRCYLKESNMMFIGGLIIAIAIEHCNLHSRISLHVIKLVGCSPRRLNLGLITVTMLVSMWISNTAATAMMIPIIEATLQELDTQGLSDMWEKPELDAPAAPPPAPGAPAVAKPPVVEEERRPTRQTMCYFMSTAYAASIGGNGTIIGSGTNLTFKGIFEARFSESPPVDFTKWMLFNIPYMLINNYLVWIFMQFWFMGLFRPNSKDAKSIRSGAQGEDVARKVINDKLTELGPMTYHEKSVALMFILAVLLWLFKKPEVIPGWAEYVTTLKVKDATPAMLVCMFLFALPNNYNWIHMWSSNEEIRPKQTAEPLVTWKVVQGRMPWGLVFLLGGGFAIAEGSKASGMSTLIANNLATVATMDKLYVMALSMSLAAFMTQFSSNVACANVLLPVLAEMSLVGKINPYFLMLPATLGCSLAFCLPVSTPPNAIAAGPCRMPSLEMVKVGIPVTLICLAVLMVVFPLWGGFVFGLGEFPEWAHSNDTEGAG